MVRDSNFHDDRNSFIDCLFSPTPSLLSETPNAREEEKGKIFASKTLNSRMQK